MTRVGFTSLYGSGWQLAATKSMYPDIGIYQSHQMVELVLELKKGIEGARNTHWFDSEGHTWLQSRSLPRLPIVRNLRLFMQLPANPMPHKLGDN